MISSRKAWMVVGMALILGFAVGWLSAVKTPTSIQTQVLKTSEEGAMTAEQGKSVSIMLDFGDGNLKLYRNLSLQSNETLFALLKRTVEANNVAFDSKSYEGLGTLVTQIGEKKNGTGNRYWQYWVNNEKVQVGADSYVVKGGDVIEWKFLGDTGS